MVLELENILDVVLPIAGGATGYILTGGNTIGTGGGLIIGSTIATVNRALDVACDAYAEKLSFKNLLGFGAGAVMTFSEIINLYMQ